jgi:hypothetical protein
MIDPSHLGRCRSVTQRMLKHVNMTTSNLPKQNHVQNILVLQRMLKTRGQSKIVRTEGRVVSKYFSCNSDLCSNVGSGWEVVFSLIGVDVPRNTPGHLCLPTKFHDKEILERKKLYFYTSHIF